MSPEALAFIFGFWAATGVIYVALLIHEAIHARKLRRGSLHGR